jgi:hypothetical protein
MTARFVLILSSIVLIAILGFLFWPNLLSLVRPDADLSIIEARYRDFLAERDLTDPIPDVNIVVVKSNRMLYLLSGDELVGRWHIALGQHPEGDKTQANDGRTPEGVYHIIDRDASSPNHLMLMLDYPGTVDADVALGQELIDQRTHQDIYRNLTNGRIPPQDTGLGGNIGIHGGGVTRNWTNGSIAVDDNVIEILWFACPIGTEVRIIPTFSEWELSGVMPSYVE